MPFGLPRRALLALGALIVAAVVVVVIVSSASAGSKSAKVTLSDFKVAVSPKSVSHGKVTLTVANHGDMEHELVVIKTTRAASKLPVSGGRASEKGAVGEVEDIAGGHSKKLTLTLAKGHYALICNLPGHYAAGMRADFTVK